MSCSLPGDVWISLNDREQKSVYRWLNNAALHYSEWEPGRPNGRHSGRCVHMDQHFHFFDSDCSDKIPASLCSTLGNFHTVLLKADTQPFEQVRLVRVKAERPNHPSRANAKQGGGGS